MTGMRPQKARDYGSTEDVVLRLFAEVGGPKEAGFLLDRKYSVIMAYADPDHTTGLTYDQARRLTAGGATSAARDLAALAGGHFVPGAVAASHADTAMVLGQSASTYGHLIALTLQALADGKICTLTETPGLKRELDRVIDELVRARNLIEASVPSHREIA